MSADDIAKDVAPVVQGAEKTHDADPLIEAINGQTEAIKNKTEAMERIAKGTLVPISAGVIVCATMLTAIFFSSSSSAVELEEVVDVEADHASLSVHTPSVLVGYHPVAK